MRGTTNVTVQESTTGADPKGGRPVLPSRGRQRPLGMGETTLTGGFWATLQQTNATATLAHCEQWMEHLGWLANFDRVADGTTGPDRAGWSFADSEVYKLIEALAWEHGRSGDQVYDDAVRRLTARIARAQDADGYLNTCFGHAGQQPRYSDLEFGHELYCTGHLLQAAVARLRTTGPDDLVAVARRAADHVCDTFGPDGLPGICGHPEIEVGLAELGRALGDSRYVEQARLFLDRRGHGTLKDIPLGRAYFQDDEPIRTAGTWRGHAVRALYLSAAAVDVAVEQEDPELLAAVERQWANAVARRTHLTGGMGSRHQDEGFGEDWELPPDRAYCETCAGVASVMVSWRLYLATGDVRYADLIERTFFNIIATSPRSDGRAFFYANPLQQRVPGAASDDDAVSPRAEGGSRAAWFDVSCCPTNVARTLATWHTYLATAGRHELTLLHYAGARIEAELGDGRIVSLEVETDYPRDGLVTVRVVRAPEGPVALRLRVPAWARGAVLDEGGRRRPVEPGLAAVDRALDPGEEIRLHLPMTPRFTWPDRRIDALRGCVAVERGPLVYCAESVDLPEGTELDDLTVDIRAEPLDQDGRVTVRVFRNHRRDPEPAWPYGTSADGGGTSTTASTELALVPYHRWAERGPTGMRVWLPIVHPAPVGSP
ncbi:glycoside hydrolase family 127 protein [Streptomyces sp. PSKA54]|uniref:Glycoside hydrolase family 127 protein n=1 Tax=Streptomyces himalayensis subsp. aureolus TaxID=2758039 RepID=A0A7W2D5A8_9ACTN|nr:beta-L-arabinofuranosidase domain-containing protein [Streptomyces himalayensis]MBA4864730.1 glycoside hydrolase family 127 protein [Streptomyces himalayensis subsp. aureolus]